MTSSEPDRAAGTADFGFRSVGEGERIVAGVSDNFATGPTTLARPTFG